MHEKYIGKWLTIGKHVVQIQSMIGEGGTAYIYKATEQRSNKPCAVKMLLVQTSEALESAQNEVAIMQQCKHPTIVNLIDVAWNKQHRSGVTQVLLLMEMVPGGNLLHRIQTWESSNIRLPEQKLLDILKSLCIPLQVLHSQQIPIAHRDIKPENYLVAAENMYKLCDFGSAIAGHQVLKSKHDRASASENVQKNTTSIYRAPELADIDGHCLFGSGTLTEKVDSWSMGCILYMLAYCKPPFAAEGLHTTQYKIPSDSVYSNRVISLIAGLLKENPSERLSIQDTIRILDENATGEVNAIPTTPIAVAHVPVHAVPRATPRSQQTPRETPNEQEMPSLPRKASEQLLDMSFATMHANAHPGEETAMPCNITPNIVPANASAAPPALDEFGFPIVHSNENDWNPFQ